MATPLTDRHIASLKPPTIEQRQCDYWDPSMRGFGVRVSYGGKKVFVVRYRVHGRLRRMTLGPYPDLSLAEARRQARMVMGDVAHGEDPAQEKIERRQVLTFRDLAREYVEMAQRRHKRWTEEKRIIEKDLVPILGHRLLTEIRRRDVRDLVEDIANKRNAPAMANRTLEMLSRMFNYAIDREWMESNPASRISQPGLEVSRDRVLTDDEIRELWSVLEQLAQPANAEPVELSAAPSTRPIRRVITTATAQAFQVQLLTGQRPGEVRDMKWSHVDLDTGWWTLPAAATKNAKAHRVPLTEWAVAILRERRRVASETAIHIFENKAGTGSILHRGKKAASLLCKILTFTFRAHDLRRTAATRMAEAGVTREHLAKVLNHIGGGATATRVYDRYTYDAEKRQALDAWARSLKALLENDRSRQKVLAFQRS
jgi:integrase